MTPEDAIVALRPLVSQILPSNATPFEKAVFAAELAALAQLNPQVIRAIWNPWICPTALLPWLAWALSVDVWDNTWTETRKRKVIAASPIVHRLKGTRGAVERALAAFDMESKIVEWWENNTRRGTFRVDMIYRDGGPAFDALTERQAIEAVKAAKPKSRVFTTRSVITARAPVFVAAFSRSVFGVTISPYAFTGETIRAGQVVAVLSASRFDVTVHPKAA